MLSRVFLVAVCVCSARAYFTPNVTSPSSVVAYRNMTKGASRGVLYAVSAPGYSDGPITVANVFGTTHYDAGYAFGALLAEECEANYEALMTSLTKGKLVIQDVLEAFLDWQYSAFIAKALPDDFIGEAQGVEDGAASVGHPLVGDMVRRGVTLSSIATGDVLFDIETLIKDEFSKHGVAARKAFAQSGMSVEAFAAAAAAALSPLGKTCSFWGTWGTRSAAGDLYTGRNLDWEADTGLSKHKLITVWHIHGRNTYAAIGFAALTGVITGMSQPGLTVHEAGDDNYSETLDGFPWALRLRALMENATDLASAKAFWEATNNTLGINHGIGSAADNKFMALETKAGYTAYFLDNDPREAAPINGTVFGFPMPEAVWRTNHGYDPTFLATARRGPSPGDSETRYMLIHDTIKGYETAQVAVDYMRAVNITAVAGDKGGSHLASFVQCGAQSVKGSNIVSAAFHPGAHVMYVAFEDGTGAAHVPACCNNYVTLDMSTFFNAQM